MQVPHPLNFHFSDVWNPEVQDCGGGVFRVSVRGDWEAHHSMVEPQLPAPERKMASEASLVAGPENHLVLSDASGNLLLHGAAGGVFGVSGTNWILQFETPKEARFYGLGEKSGPLEKSGVRTVFWNVDGWGVHSLGEVESGDPDPLYASIPWVMLRSGTEWVGIWIRNPGKVFCSLGADLRLHSLQQPLAETGIYFGAEDGAPEVWFLVADTPARLVQKFQGLVGRVPVPPLWTLGHHQSRWGYTGKSDLERLDRLYRRHRIPCDGLWLDIDYMNGFRVFTTDPRHLPDPQQDLARIRKRGRRVVAILDPGVKDDPGWEVRDDGIRENVFCHNAAGGLYRGFVWPGVTLFPDFLDSAAREWWTKRVAGLAVQGFDAFWIDMNDPSTGAARPDDMRFCKGALPHWAGHNQYAHGMAMATREGLQQAYPGMRPFVLSRSACAGTNALTAIWTGDNWSNWHHLQRCIPMSLGLSLSGFPFQGPDVPGFGGNATAELAQRWYQACFLFPFLRNHCVKDGVNQEPWAFGARTMRIIGDYIRLRYRLLPYLYQQFIAQETEGSPILRPMFHDYPAMKGADLLDDQFLVGSDVLQAPMLEAGKRERRVVVPPGEWFFPGEGWLRGGTLGGRKVRIALKASATGLAFRAGSVTAWAPDVERDTVPELSHVDLVAWIQSRKGARAQGEYRWDDGISLDTSDRGLAQLDLLCSGTGQLRGRLVLHKPSQSVLRMRIVVPGQWKSLSLEMPDGTLRELCLQSYRLRFPWTQVGCMASEELVLAGSETERPKAS